MCNHLSKFFNKHNSATVFNRTASNCLLQTLSRAHIKCPLQLYTHSCTSFGPRNRKKLEGGLTKSPPQPQQATLDSKKSDSTPATASLPGLQQDCQGNWLGSNFATKTAKKLRTNIDTVDACEQGLSWRNQRCLSREGQRRKKLAANP